MRIKKTENFEEPYVEIVYEVIVVKYAAAAK